MAFFLAKPKTSKLHFTDKKSKFKKLFKISFLHKNRAESKNYN